MPLIKGIELTKYRAVKHVKLDGCSRLNILVGPNNCGKTSILEAISGLSRLETYNRYLCSTCQAFFTSRREYLESFAPPYLSMELKESFMDKGKTELVFSFDYEEIEKEVPNVIQKQRAVISGGNACRNDDMLFKQEDLTMYSDHVSPLHHRDIVNWIKDVILFLPEERLQTYKDKSIIDYIRQLNLRGDQLKKWVHYLGELVDRKISDYTQSLDLVRVLDEGTLEASLQDQGSGVRSLACLIADIVASERARILLIDEPELGLNPRSKQSLVIFLLGLGNKQIFITTHDSTFVNPSLWRQYSSSIFLYSPSTEEFVKVNLEQNHEDPETFAGYLPHTTSLKDVHIYVEGSSDVYILDTFFRKHVKQARSDWAQVLSRVGIFHLGGDFWPHLLDTIPECPPYRCLIILDGDKRQQIAQRATSLKGFVVCSNLNEVEKSIGTAKSIYCWVETDIEKYLDQNKIPSTYNKKMDGPRIADEMKQVPKEMQELFDIILRNGIDITHYVVVRNSGVVHNSISLDN